MKNLMIIIMIVLSTNLFSQNCELNSNNAFGNNEYLKYKVFYNWKDVWLKAGTVTFEVENEDLSGKPTFHITAKGKTYPFYNWFFKVNDVYETYVEKESVLPLKFIRDVHEGGYKLDHEYVFNRNTLMVNTKSKVNKEKLKIKEFSFNECTHDMLSSIYYMRTIDFKGMKIGEEKPIEVFLDNEFYNLTVVYKGRAIVDTKFGKINCIKVIPKIVAGRIFKEDESMVVYVSDDQNKIPVLIETPLNVGSIKILLEDYDDLKNEFQSLN